MESWHWTRESQLWEDARHYRVNGAAVMATLRTAAMNMLRPARSSSIREVQQAVINNITAILAMARPLVTTLPRDLNQPGLGI